MAESGRAVDRVFEVWDTWQFEPEQAARWEIGADTKIQLKK